MSLEGFLNDLKSDLSDLVYSVLESIINIGVDVLNAIPVPEFMGELEPLLVSIPQSVLYWIEPLHLGFGLGLVSSALVARQLVRLIPYVGSAF